MTALLVWLSGGVFGFAMHWWLTRRFLADARREIQSANNCATEAVKALKAARLAAGTAFDVGFETGQQ